MKTLSVKLFILCVCVSVEVMGSRKRERDLTSLQPSLIVIIIIIIYKEEGGEKRRRRLKYTLGYIANTWPIKWLCSATAHPLYNNRRKRRKKGFFYSVELLLLLLLPWLNRDLIKTNDCCFYSIRRVSLPNIITSLIEGGPGPHNLLSLNKQPTQVSRLLSAFIKYGHKLIRNDRAQYILKLSWRESHHHGVASHRFSPATEWYIHNPRT